MSEWKTLMMISLMSLAGLPGLSGAQPLRPEKMTVTTGVGNYTFDPKYFYLGYSIKVLKTGLYIGTLANVADVGADQNTSQQDLGPALQAVVQNNQSEAQRAKGTMNATFANMNKAPGVVPEVSSRASGGLTMGKGQSVAKDFESCAKSALLLLKNKVHVSKILMTETRSAFDQRTLQRELDVLETRLQEHRSQSGVPCGAGHPFLEETAISDEVEVIKVLSALLSRTGEERTQLLQTLAVAFGPHANATTRQSWSLMWMRLSVLAVFSDQPLPKWESVIADLKDNSEQQIQGPQKSEASFQVRWRRDLSGVDKDLEDGRELLKVHYAQK